jgi:hypothetical protein
MSEESGKSLFTHITIGVVVVAILIAVYFWPGEPQEEPVIVEPEPIVLVPTVDDPVEPELTPQITEPLVETEPEPEPEVLAPEPLDVSDGTVKTRLLKLSDYEAFARLLVDDGILQRFVIMTTSLANEEVPANHQFLNPPEKPFRTYQQADKEWIDPASYKRYTPYVDVLESLETNSLLELYALYKPAIDEIFAEISDPDDEFDEKLIMAIDLLLNTPEVPVPVEVYTDSVMFKYKDSQLESLTAPQKQLLRTGPENMRRIKAKLREFKEAL